MISVFRVPAAILKSVACLLLLLPAGRGKAAVQSGAPKPPLSLEQTLNRYVRDPQITKAIFTVLSYAPANLRPGFEAELAQRINDEAIAKHEGRKLRDDLTAVWKMRDVYQMGLTTTGGPDGVRTLTAAMEVFYKSGNVIRDAIDIRSLDALGAPATGASDAALPPQAEVAAVLQEAASGITDPTNRREAQQAIDRMHPEVRRALVQLVKQFVRPYGSNAVPMVQGVLLPLAMQLNHPDKLAMFNNPNPFGEAVVPLIEVAAGAPRSVGPLGDALNVMTRYSPHYAQVDWRPVLIKYARQGASDYLTDNLGKMLAESIEATPATRPVSSPAH